MLTAASSISFGYQNTASVSSSSEEGWRDFKRWFNRSRGKTPDQIAEHLLAAGFEPKDRVTYVHEDSGIRVHIDAFNHGKHIDVHLPGEPKKRMAYLA